MSGLVGHGLSKLKISAYKDHKYDVISRLGEIKVVYNPDSLDLSYAIDYDAEDYINSAISTNHFKKARPGELQLELLFDSSLPGSKKSVDAQLAELQLLCFQPLGSTMETPYLKVEWGKMHWHGKEYFAGRAASLQIRYTRFKRNGEPQRATVRLTLTADSSQTLNQAELAMLAAKQASCVLPDLSWLPMAAAMLATAAGVVAFSYLAVASANDLDSLDAAEPGGTLVAPDEVENTEDAP